LNKKDAQIKILALAVYELRLLLSHHLGSEEQESQAEALSAHLAYSLHNDALAIIENREEDFDIDKTLSSIEKVDNMFGNDFNERFKKLLVTD